MKLDPARWPASWVPAIPALIIALLAVLAVMGILHGTAGGVLVAVGFGVFGAIIWRADGIAWLDTASWTVPLGIWVLVAWVSFSEVPYLVAASWRRHGSQPSSSGCRPSGGGTGGSSGRTRHTAGLDGWITQIG
jgi:hypothetical protein